MRVLWLTAALPGEALRYLGLPSAGGPLSWLDGLSAGVGTMADVELAIASLSQARFKSFDSQSTRYFCLPPSRLSGWAPLLRGGWTDGSNCAEVLHSAEDVIKAWRPDVIHVHGTESPLGLLARYRGIPSVISMQGVLAGCQSAFFRGISARDAVSLTISRSFLRASGEVHGYLRLRRMVPRERLMLRRCSHVEGRTEFDRAYVTAVNPGVNYHHCDEIMRPVFYGPPWQDNRADGRPRVVFTTSSAMLFKGTECLLEAAAILSRSRGQRVVLRVAGAPDAGEVGRFLRRRANLAGVGGLVTWLGRLDADQLADEIRRCDVFAYPSHMDNSPNSLVEAQLLGAPCVAARTGGIPSLLDAGTSGLLFAPGDADDLACKLETLLADRALAREVGEGAKRMARERNDPKRIVDLQLDIYRDVIKGTQ